MRVLFLSDNFIPETNAAASRVYERACYWTDWGHQVTILTSAPNKPEGKVYPGYKNAWFQREMVHGIEVIRVKTFVTKNEGFALRLIDFFSYMFMAFLVGLVLPKPNVVCATSPQFFTAVSGWAIAKLRGLPFVFEVADLWPGSLASTGVIKFGFFLRLAEKVELFLYRQAKRVVTLTQSFKKDLIARGIAPDKISVILNGVDLPRLHFQPRDTELSIELKIEKKFVVAYLGTHGMAQGLKNIVDWIADPRLTAASDIQFLFAGGGAERELVVRHAAKLGLKNVTFLTAQPKSAMAKLWSVVDLALVSLKNDPVFAQVIPSKIFEAMGAGKPILLVSPPGEGHTIVNDTHAGWSVEPTDRDGFINCILTAARDRKIYQAAQVASQSSAPNFSRQTQARLFIEALETSRPLKILEAPTPT